MGATVAAICVAMSDAIGAIAPVTYPGDRFRESRSEGAGDFLAWCEDNPAAAWRRFQVRGAGVEPPPAVSSTSEEWRRSLFEIIVAYPLTHRAGELGAVDRDRLIESDMRQLEASIGQHGGAVLHAAGASWMPDGYQVSRLPGQACDFLVVHQTCGYWRTFA